MPTEIIQPESSTIYVERPLPTYHLNSGGISLDLTAIDNTVTGNSTAIIPNNSSSELPTPHRSRETEKTASKDYNFDVLQELLLADEQAVMAENREQLGQALLRLGQLENRMNDQEALIKVVNPVIAKSIEAAIQENRDQMIDVLYPIIGSLIQRAVSESMIDMKRQIDSQMNEAFGLEQLKCRLQGWFTGVPIVETVMVDALPFDIGSIFFIHRETGIPIIHLANDSTNTITDSDIIGGMLTAIRDFMADVFASGDENHNRDSDEIQQGNNRILIESARYSYIAVVTNGYAPRGFRTSIKELLFDIESKHADLLRNYDGDATPFESARTQLYDFMVQQNDEQSNRQTEPAPPQPNLLNRLETWVPEPLQAQLHIAFPFVLLILTILIFFL